MNLLPQQQKDAIYKDILVRVFSVALLVVSFWALIFIVLAYNTALYLNLQMPAIEERLKMERETQKANIVQSVEGGINKLNETLLSIDKIRKKETFNFPYILRLAGETVPKGANLRSITFQNEMMTISGYADERVQVLKLKENLEKESTFKNLISPLSNIVKERDINFTFTFSL